MEKINKYIVYDEGFKSGFFHTYKDLKICNSNVSRKIQVYLPKEYNDSSNLYSVIYLNDGQTAFWPKGLSPYSWRVQYTLEKLYSNKTIKPVIIVAVYPNDRNYEYLHVKEISGFLNKSGGGLSTYAKYLTNLKKFIDNNYRTKKSSNTTAIVGSSHGGLASFYTASVYSDSFGICGAFSPSFWAGGVFSLSDTELLKQIGKYLKLNNNNRPKFWIDWGMRRLSLGLHDFLIERQAARWGKKMVSLLQSEYKYILGKDLFSYEDKIGGHDERAWEYRFDLFLKNFYKNNEE